MQYILSEKEYSDLKREQNMKAQLATDRLQQVCTLAAQHIPISREWRPDDPPRPWGCILGPRNQNPGYCDNCPVSDLCPHQFKEWSK